MNRLIGRFKNWLFRRRVKRVEKDMLIVSWAFSEARSIVSLYRQYHAEREHALQKRNRARSRKMRKDWDYDARVLGDRMSKLQSRLPGVCMEMENAVLEATFHMLVDFYENHKHSIVGQYK